MTEGGFRGMTVSTLVSVSIEPPLILVCLEVLSLARDAIVASGRFSANVLAREQEFLAERFAGQAPVVDLAWSQINYRTGHLGLPLIEGSAAQLECVVEAVHRAGDHDIVVGRVEGLALGSTEPLVRWDHAYWRLS
jgi:3-hydroxy-9,10-secoandrosta-1,3,5(10)-triene-9,17-dione monooxygenase reductase component